MTAFLDRSYAALVLDELEEYDECIAAMSAAIKSTPANAIALNNRGVAYFETGRIDEAARDFTAAMESDATDPMPCLNLAKLLDANGRPGDAIPLYDAAIDREPINVFLRRSRAYALQSLKRHEDAISDFTAAIEIDPAFPQTYFDRGVSFDAIGDSSSGDADRLTANQLKHG